MMEEATGVNQVQWCHLTMVIMEDQAVDLGQAIMDLEEVRPFPETDPAQELELGTVALSTLENNISSVQSIYRVSQKKRNFTLNANISAITWSIFTPSTIFWGKI